MRRQLAALAVVLAATGCVGSPADEGPQPTSPTGFADENGEDHADALDEPETGDPDNGTERDVRAASLRLRVTGGLQFGPSTGSGFALGPRTVITNAHVLGFGSQAELVSWDGRESRSITMEVARFNDIARVTTDDVVPAEPLELASANPSAGDTVTVVGFPEGGRITVEKDARVVELTDGEPYLELGEVLRLDSDTVRPGSSGGPVLDADGEVVGVVFAIEQATGYALAIPVSTLHGLLGR